MTGTFSLALVFSTCNEILFLLRTHVDVTESKDCILPFVLIGSDDGMLSWSA